MSYLISIVVFIVIFSILILVHEFGHFFAAKKAGVKVEEFGMGLPPRLKGLWTDKHGTVYSLNWIPFGGFVRMYGEDSEDSGMRVKPGSFASKSIPARTIIILGGVIMNFLLGYILLVILFTAGTKPFIVTPEDFQYYRNQGVILAEDRVVVNDFSEHSSALVAGLQKGDILKTINALPVKHNEDVIRFLAEKPHQSVPVVVIRDKKDLSFNVTTNEEGKMGVVISDSPDIKEVHEVRYSFTNSLSAAAYEVVRLSWLTMKMFLNVIIDLFTKFQISAQVSGPVGIAQMTHQTTQNGSFLDILKLVALLSISLGAINVLPIPALDGGRFLSIIFEVVTRKRPDASWEAKIHAFGFLIILILIAVVTFHDITKLFAAN